MTAEKPSVWRSRYDISVNDQHVARWEPSWCRSGGVFELDGQRYQVRGNALGSRFELIGSVGQPLASAQRVGRKRWTVQAGDRTYEFRRASVWRGDQELLLADQAVGSIRRRYVNHAGQFGVQPHPRLGWPGDDRGRAGCGRDGRPEVATVVLRMNSVSTTSMPSLLSASITTALSESPPTAIRRRL